MVDSVMKYIEQGNYSFVFLVIALSLVVNLEKIISLFSEQRKQRLATLEQTSSIENLSPRLRNHLADEMQVEVFYLAHGLKVSKITLNGLLALEERVGARISFKHILRVGRLVPDLERVEEQAFQIELPWYDKFYSLYNLVIGFPGFILSILWFSYSLSIVFTVPNYPSLVVSSLAAVVSLAMLYQGAPYISTRIVNAELRNMKECGAVE
ncbi:hypothetical protein QNZ74_004538 [Vibrio parahaemolyticus]|nr:hypothetical protein [Vibrio parahaemolyticus]